MYQGSGRGMFDILEWRTDLIMTLFSKDSTRSRIETSIVAQWLACWAHNPAVLRSKLSDAIPVEGTFKWSCHFCMVH